MHNKKNEIKYESCGDSPLLCYFFLLAHEELDSCCLHRTMLETWGRFISDDETDTTIVMDEDVEACGTSVELHITSHPSTPSQQTGKKLTKAKRMLRYIVHIIKEIKEKQRNY